MSLSQRAHSRRCLAALSNHNVPIPTCCLDRPPLPHSLRSVIGSSVFETLQASINKRGVSPAAARSPGKATAAKALTWRFTQTLSGLAMRQQQNVRLLLLSTSSQACCHHGRATVSQCCTAHWAPVHSRDRQCTELNHSNKQRQSPYQPQSCSRSPCPK